MLYNPPHFRATEVTQLLDAIAASSFATLVSNTPQGPVVTHLPLLIDRQAGPNGTLIGHIAKANPHWAIADLAAPSIAIFHGPDTYVSPNWYPSKKEAGRAVPTWNYTVIHATGIVRIHDNPDWLRDAVARLTDRHEAGRPAAWSVKDAPDRYIAGQLKGIVGLSLEITSLEGKFKLSQNRSEADRAGVITGLDGESAPGSAAVRALMTARDQDVSAG